IDPVGASRASTEAGAYRKAARREADRRQEAAPLHRCGPAHRGRAEPVAPLTPAFLDTSVLVAGLIEIGDASANPQKIMAAIADGQFRQAVTAWHCCLEFYSVATRLPEEFRLPPADALRLLEEEILARLDVRQLPPPAHAPFLRALEHDRVIGGRVYDA